MEKEYTPAEIRPNRTVFRFTEQEVIHALTEYASKYLDVTVPKGKRFIWAPERDGREVWMLTLGVDRHDPPPAQQDVDDD